VKGSLFVRVFFSSGSGKGSLIKVSLLGFFLKRIRWKVLYQGTFLRVFFQVGQAKGP